MFETKKKMSFSPTPEKKTNRTFRRFIMTAPVREIKSDRPLTTVRPSASGNAITEAGRTFRVFGLWRRRVETAYVGKGGGKRGGYP